MDLRQFSEERNICLLENCEETDTVDPDAKQQQLIKQIKKKEPIQQIQQIQRLNSRFSIIVILLQAIVICFLVYFLLIKNNFVENQYLEPEKVEKTTDTKDHLKIMSSQALGNKQSKWKRSIDFLNSQLDRRKIQSYEGDWFNDMKHGNGEYKYSNGDKYKGQFVEDVKSGSGQMQYSNKDRQHILQFTIRYQGQWLNDMKEGSGKYFSFNLGNRYEGEFKGDLKEGKGIQHFGNKNQQVVLLTIIAKSGSTRMIKKTVGSKSLPKKERKSRGFYTRKEWKKNLK